MKVTGIAFWSVSAILLLPSSSVVFVHGAAKKNELKVKSCVGGKSSRRCNIDSSAFNPTFLAGDVIDIDFGPGRQYKCHSQGRGGSSTCTTATAADGSLFGTAIVGDMNVVTRGKNSRGEDYIFGSTSVGDDICDIGPDATGSNIVQCKSMRNYPLEADVEVL